MLLVRAENELRSNENVGEAITLINEGRVYHGLEPVTAASIDEAWDHLHRERGADLWLEGRRFWDLRRWFADGAGTPSYHNFLEGRDTCVPIGKQEIGRASCRERVQGWGVDGG